MDEAIDTPLTFKMQFKVNFNISALMKSELAIKTAGGTIVNAG